MILWGPTICPSRFPTVLLYQSTLRFKNSSLVLVVFSLSTLIPIMKIPLSNTDQPYSSYANIMSFAPFLSISLRTHTYISLFLFNPNVFFFHYLSDTSRYNHSFQSQEQHLHFHHLYLFALSVELLRSIDFLSIHISISWVFLNVHLGYFSHFPPSLSLFSPTPFFFAIILVLPSVPLYGAYQQPNMITLITLLLHIWMQD